MGGGIILLTPHAKGVRKQTVLAKITLPSPADLTACGHRRSNLQCLSYPFSNGKTFAVRRTAWLGSTGRFGVSLLSPFRRMCGLGYCQFHNLHAAISFSESPVILEMVAIGKFASNIPEIIWRLASTIPVS